MLRPSLLELLSPRESHTGRAVPALARTAGAQTSSAPIGDRSTGLLSRLQTLGIIDPDRPTDIESSKSLAWHR